MILISLRKWSVSKVVIEQEKLLRLEHANEKVIFVKSKFRYEIVVAVGRHSERTELPFPLPKWQYSDYYITDENFEYKSVDWDYWEKVTVDEAAIYFKNNQDMEIRI